MPHVTFPKPSRLATKAQKWIRTQARKAAKRADDRVRQREEQAIHDQVWTRDKSTCRAYGLRLKRNSDNPFIVGHCHHVIFRSLGGPSTTANEVLLSAIAHERAHGRHDRIVLDISGNANETLTFTERDRETGQVLKTWESPCV